MQEIQSLSITVPTSGCVNNCKYCVSKMHNDSWIKDRFKGKSEALNNFGSIILNNNKLVINDADIFQILNFEKIQYELQDFYERIKFARDNGVNTVILTGVDGEILQNKPFLRLFSILNNLLPSPFSWIEAQTSGVMLDYDNLQFLKNIGVKTISLSISDIFDEKSNAEITQIPKALEFNLDELCKSIKEMNFNLRLSLNVSDCYNDIPAYRFFKRANELFTDQITFRVLYTSDEDSDENKWIENHRIDENVMERINQRILNSGEFIGVLTFGAKKYGVSGISTVIDDDCMNEEIKDELKYLILREDLKLYTRWNKKSSLLF